MPRRTPLAVILLVVIGVLVGRGLPHTGGDGGRRTTLGAGAVVRVVDGDTIRVRLNGRSERVRYIGVDTPESVKPGTPVQCYAERAAAANRSLVAGRRVRLVADAEERDRFGRLLAYVYREPDGAFVNAALVRYGYARTLTIPPNVAHREDFSRLAAEARHAGRGLWRACS
ncbi:MAG: thermonuclease family protein [Solirubrobacteraceae bacterium]